MPSCNTAALGAADAIASRGAARRPEYAAPPLARARWRRYPRAMTRNPLLALALIAALSGCSNTKPEERKLPASAVPAGSAAPGTQAPTAPAPAGSSAGSAERAPASGSAAAVHRGTGFSPFDDALAGRAPWPAPDPARGVTELEAVSDLSGRTPGRAAVSKRCGDAAAQLVTGVGKQLTERAASADREPATCKVDGVTASCTQRGIAEGDVTITVDYARTGDAWHVVGVQRRGVGEASPAQDTAYAAQRGAPCA
jgi:hypothetical protein